MRDYLDNIIVRTNGAFVAGYELKGLTSYFASDDGRDRRKWMLEALLRSIPEAENALADPIWVVEDVGGLRDQYAAGQKSGHYMPPPPPLLHAYLVRDLGLHRRLAGEPLKPKGELFSLSANKSIDRSRQEHDDLPAEFESLLCGVETAAEAAELGALRRTDGELFLETKRAVNPLNPDRRAYRRGTDELEFRSAHEQLADVSIVDETDTYLNLVGVLYAFVSPRQNDRLFGHYTGEKATMNAILLRALTALVPTSMLVSA